MTVLVICLCFLVCIERGELEMSSCIKWWCSLIFGIIIILLFAVIFVLFICDYRSIINAAENQYYVLAEKNTHYRSLLKKQKNILVYKSIDCIFPHQFSGFYELEKIEFYGNIEIQEAAFFGCTNLSEIVFHSKDIRIGENVFAACKKLKTIKYAGTKDDWNNVCDNFGNDWKKDTHIDQVICRDNKSHKFEDKDSNKIGE